MIKYKITSLLNAQTGPLRRMLSLLKAIAHRPMQSPLAAFAALIMAVGAFPPDASAAETSEVRIVKQIGLGFLPIMVMEHEKLIEKHTGAAGLGDVKGVYATTVGPAVMNDAMLAGRIDIGTNGPTSIILIWSRTRGTDNEIKGMAAMITSPMWLNSNNPRIKTIRDIAPTDRIAVPGIKTSNQAMVLQMAAGKEWGKDHSGRLDAQTVAMSHFDGMAALLSRKEITLHLTSPPVMYLELEQPGIHRVLNSDDVLGGPITFSNIFSSSKFRNANPRTYRAALAAFTEAIALINTHGRTFISLRFTTCPAADRAPDLKETDHAQAHGTAGRRLRLFESGRRRIQ